NLADLDDLAPLDWADVRQRLEANLTQEPGSGGPDHHTFWLSTVDPDGRPHMTAVGAFWVDGRYYFSGGPPPWYVYEFVPEDAYAVATTEPGGATRWTF